MQKTDITELDQDIVDVLKGLYAQGRLQELLTHALTLADEYPNAPLIPSLLCVVYNDLGRGEEAIECGNRALELQPDNAGMHNNIAGAYFNLCRYGEAATSFRRALELRPDYPGAHNNLGSALTSLGRYDEAVVSYRKALDLQPDHAGLHNNLGIALSGAGQYEQAAASYRRTLELQPDFSEAYYNLGSTLVTLRRREEAIDCFKEAVSLDENYNLARGALFFHLGHICDWGQIQEITRGGLASLEFGSTPREVASPFGLLALIDDAAFHRRVSEACTLANHPQRMLLGPLSSRKSVGRIRIGYFSADFHLHPVMCLMAEMYEQHDRSKFEIHAFSFGPDIKDEMHARLVKGVEVFHDVRSKGDSEVAALARSLGIDVAVDLNGYTTHARTGIFSYRAAPVQIHYLGYPGSMGSPYFDYIVADPIMIPPDYQKFYTEKVLYLPNSYQVNDGAQKISDKIMSRTDFGLLEDAFVFCCFNNNYKITSDVFDVWMRLLANVEGSVLWLFKANQAAVENLRNEALKRGIEPGRLVFAERMPLSEHLARQRLADLFLDTFNYNAHATASGALWAGLPVLTKMGESFPSRAGASLLNAVGLPELITSTAQEYEDVALRLAAHPHELKVLKDKLGCNLKTTSLFDAALFARHIESAYEKMLMRVDEGLESDHIYVKN